MFELLCESAPEAVDPALRPADDVALQGRIFLHGPGFGEIP
ncbi:hypothetical protein I552_2556 [Mycobacterium xenopi 3993]|nr:hypothetical protein I552_2556 [Mycobacterium xenopi 3993]